MPMGESYRCITQDELHKMNFKRLAEEISKMISSSSDDQLNSTGAIHLGTEAVSEGSSFVSLVNQTLWSQGAYQLEIIRVCCLYLFCSKNQWILSIFNWCQNDFRDVRRSLLSMLTEGFFAHF